MKCVSSQENHCEVSGLLIPTGEGLDPFEGGQTITRRYLWYDDFTFMNPMIESSHVDVLVLCIPQGCGQEVFWIIFSTGLAVTGHSRI